MPLLIFIDAVNKEMVNSNSEIVYTVGLYTDSEILKTEYLIPNYLRLNIFEQVVPKYLRLGTLKTWFLNI